MEKTKPENQGLGGRLNPGFGFEKSRDFRVRGKPGLQTLITPFYNNPRFNHTTIWQFTYTAIPLVDDWTIPPIDRFDVSTMPTFDNFMIQPHHFLTFGQFNNSSSAPLNDFKLQPYHHSTIQPGWIVESSFINSDCKPYIYSYSAYYQSFEILLRWSVWNFYRRHDC